MQISGGTIILERGSSKGSGSELVDGLVCSKDRKKAAWLKHGELKAEGRYQTHQITWGLQARCLGSVSGAFGLIPKALERDTISTQELRTKPNRVWKVLGQQSCLKDFGDTEGPMGRTQLPNLTLHQCTLHWYPSSPHLHPSPHPPDTSWDHSQINHSHNPGSRTALYILQKQVLGRIFIL